QWRRRTGTVRAEQKSSATAPNRDAEAKQRQRKQRRRRSRRDNRAPAAARLRDRRATRVAFPAGVRGIGIGLLAGNNAVLASGDLVEVDLGRHLHLSAYGDRGTSRIHDVIESGP